LGQLDLASLRVVYPDSTGRLERAPEKIGMANLACNIRRRFSG
jgi:hypothetical protein